MKLNNTFKKFNFRYINFIFVMLVTILTLFYVNPITVKAENANEIGYTPEDETWNVDNVNDALDGIRRIVIENDCLKTLSTTDGELSPEFDSLITNYNLSLDVMEDEFTLEGEAVDSAAVVVGVGTYTLDVGETRTINVSVTSREGNVRTYSVVATRYDLEDGTHNSKLKKLEVQNYALTPKFKSLKTSYQTTVSNHEIDLNIII